jgi:hypothetical protein
MSPMVPLPISFVRFMPVHVHLIVRCQAYHGSIYVRLEAIRMLFAIVFMSKITNRFVLMSRGATS